MIEETGRRVALTDKANNRGQEQARDRPGHDKGPAKQRDLPREHPDRGEG